MNLSIMRLECQVGLIHYNYALHEDDKYTLSYSKEKPNYG